MLNALRSFNETSSKKPCRSLVMDDSAALSISHLRAETPLTLSLPLAQFILLLTSSGRLLWSHIAAASDRSFGSSDDAGCGPIVWPPKVTHSCLPITVCATSKLPSLIFQVALSGLTKAPSTLNDTG